MLSARFPWRSHLSVFICNLQKIFTILNIFCLSWSILNSLVFAILAKQLMVSIGYIYIVTNKVKKKDGEVFRSDITAPEVNY